MSDGPGSGEDAARPERAPSDARGVAWGRRERLGQSTAESKGLGSGKGQTMSDGPESGENAARP